MKVVIIGNHAAGISAAETLRQRDPSCEVLVISIEDTPPYSRCMLPFLVSGERDLDEILYRPRTFYEDLNIRTMFGVEVARVLASEKQVLLSDGQRIDYDALVIANGGTPSLPRIPGIENEGVFGFRNLEDARRIIDFADRIEVVGVLGGGLVGLKAAIALNVRGRKVKVIVGSPNVLSQIIGPHEAAIYERYLTELGIEIMTRNNPALVLGEGKVEGVETTEGVKIPCQMVVVGKGVDANRALVRDSGIKTEYGIVVDDHCRTNLSDVYAAGDIAQSRDDVRGQLWMNSLWPFAIEEGRVAAENILGLDTTLRPRTSMNSFTIGQLRLITCGLTGAREEIEGAEEITTTGPGKNDGRRLVLKDNRLVGFALVGDVRHAGVLTSLVTRGLDLSSVKDGIVAGRYDFASIVPFIRDNQATFTEPEYQEVLRSLQEPPEGSRIAASVRRTS